MFPQNICENTSQRKWKSRRFQCTLPSCGSTGEIELPFLSVQHRRIRRIPFHQCFPFSACFRPVSAPPEQHIPLSRFCFPAAQPAADCRPTETSHDKKNTPFHFRYGGVLHAAKNPFTMDTIEQPEMLHFFKKFFRFVGMYKVMTSICAYRTISVFQSRFEKKRSIFRRFML